MVEFYKKKERMEVLFKNIFESVDFFLYNFIKIKKFLNKNFSLEVSLSHNLCRDLQIFFFEVLFKKAGNLEILFPLFKGIVCPKPNLYLLYSLKVFFEDLVKSELFTTVEKTEIAFFLSKFQTLETLKKHRQEALNFFIVNFERLDLVIKNLQKNKEVIEKLKIFNNN